MKPTRRELRAALRKLERAIATLEECQHMPGAQGVDLANAKSDLMRRLGELERLAQ